MMAARPRLFLSRVCVIDHFRLDAARLAGSRDHLAHLFLLNCGSVAKRRTLFGGVAVAR
jgi:hypothetical protein